MKQKKWLNMATENLSRVVLRFSQTIILVIGMSILLVVAVYETEKQQAVWLWIATALLSVLWSAVGYLLLENRLSWLRRNLIILLGVGGLVVLRYSWNTPMNTANTTQVMLLFIAFFVGLFFAPFVGQKEETHHMWLYAKEVLLKLLTSYLFATILMVGLVLSQVSIETLFGIKLDSKVIVYLSIGCFALFFPLYFFSSLPTKKDITTTPSIPYPKLFQVLGMYILLPILSIYVVILYLYLFKIVFQWTLPNGWVSLLVSVLGVVGVMTLLLLHPLYAKGKNKFVIRYARWFPLILMPLLALMLVGIVRRYIDYGITINRVLVFALNCWMWGVALYLSITQIRQPKWMLISFSLLAFAMAFFAPTYTKLSLTANLTQLLPKAHFGEKEVAPTMLSEEEQRKVLSTSDYLQGTYGETAIETLTGRLGEQCTKNSLLEKLAIEREHKKIERNYFQMADDVSIDIDIKGYRSFSHFYAFNYDDEKEDNKNFTIHFQQDTVIINSLENNLVVTIPLGEKIAQYRSSDKWKQSIEDMTIEQDSCKLIIRYIETKESDIISSLQGYLFIK